jgi:hypothetical protein
MRRVTKHAKVTAGFMCAPVKMDENIFKNLSFYEAKS